MSAPEPLIRLARSALGVAATRSRAVFWSALGVYFIAYWLAQIATQKNLALDAIEMLAWGREWQLAYWKHPPLPAWVSEILYQLGGGSEAVLFLASPLFVAATFWAVWRLSLRMLAPGLALLATAALIGSVYYGFTASEFNHNVVQYPVFALVPLLLHRALSATERGERAYSDWLLLGATGALAVYAKYSTVPLLFAAALFLIVHPRGRKALAAPGPWLGLVLALALIAPHLIALAQMDFLPLSRPGASAAQTAHWWQRVTFPVWFMLGQLFNCLGILLILAAMRLPPRTPRARAEMLGDPRQASRFDRFFVYWMLGAPLVLVIAYSVLAGQDLETMWGSPFFALLGLAGVVSMTRAPSVRGAFAALTLIVLLFVAGLAGYALKNIFEPATAGRGMRAQFSGAALAQAIEQRWQSQFPGKALPVIAGSSWNAGNISSYSADRPPVFIHARPEASPWIDADTLWREGAIFVWAPREANRIPDWVDPWIESLCPQDIITLGWQSWVEDLEPIRIAWATYGKDVCGKPAAEPPVSDR